MTTTISVLYAGADAESVVAALADCDRLAATAVENAADALDAVAAGGVDCLVADHREGGLDGLALLDAVRERHADLPVVLYPTDAAEAVARRAVAAHATDYFRRDGDDGHAGLTDRVVAAVTGLRSADGPAGLDDELHLKNRAMDAAPVGIVLTDLRREDNPIVYANEGFARVTGYDASAALGRNCRFLQGEATNPDAVAVLREAVENHETATVVLRNYRADGTAFWNQVTIAPVTDAAGTVTHFVGFQRDVTEREERERQLRRQNDLLERLHGATQRLLSAPDRECAIETAVESIDEVLGHPIATLWTYDAERTALVPAASTDRAEELLDDIPVYTEGEGLSWEAFATGRTRMFDDVTERAARHNPDTRIRSEIILPLGDWGLLNIGATEPDAFTDTDVTVAELWAATVSVALARFDRERKLRERERELTRERNRLEEFAGLVSHDLRNPLNVAVGHLDLASEECGSDHIDAAEDALDRMAVLIDDMLTLARQGTTVDEVEPVSLADLAESCWGNVSTTNATLRVEGDATLHADRSRLTQVFENLFRNAVEHGTPEDGPGADGSGVTITVGVTADGFYVADDGPGIPDEERERVFEPGYSTTEDGTGFGLKIVRDVVEAHGWTLDLTESASGGARFEVGNVDFETDG